MQRIRSIFVVIVRITVITVIFSWLALELLLRLLTQSSPEGMTLYQGMPLRPLAIPLSYIEPEIEAYLADADDARLIYHQELGWTFAANLTTPIVTNDIGLRANRDYTLDADDGIVRVAVFGDSYIAGDEVADDETFAVALEDALLACGVAAEVLNFGVSGYGMDQAYLRWKIIGREYQPDIVIMGFQPENMNRNVNIVRPLVGGPGIPFTKPRFVLTEDESLILVNSPTIAPEDLVSVYQTFDDSGLVAYEWHYNARYQPRALDNSYLLGLLEARQYNLAYAERIFVPALTPEDERVQVTIALLRQFAADVADANQDFVVLHMPMRPMIEDFLAGDGFSYDFVLDVLAAEMPLIRAENAFVAVDEADWAPAGHYTAQTHQRVAELAAAWLNENNARIQCQ